MPCMHVLLLMNNIYADSRFGRSSVKKGECVRSGCDLDNVLESWKDGILTIGTFGYDPLKHFSQHDQLFPEGWSDDDDDDDHQYINNNTDNMETGDAGAAAGKLEEEEELNPLIFSKLRDDCGYLEYEYPSRSMSRKMVMWKAEAAAADDQSPSADVDDEITKRSSGGLTSKRTTLADLFFAESSSSSELLTNHKLALVHLEDHPSSSSTVVLPRHIAGEKKKKQHVEASCIDQSNNNSAGQQYGSPNKLIHTIADKAENHDNPRPVKIKRLHQVSLQLI